MLRRCAEVDKLCLIILPVSAAVYGVYAAYAIPRGIGMFGTDCTEFYHMNTFDFAICVVASLLAMSLCHFIAKYMPDGLMHVVTRICSDLTKIYIAQWIIIMWVVYAFMTDYMDWQLPVGWLFVVGVVVLLLSIGWARLKPLSKLKM